MKCNVMTWTKAIRSGYNRSEYSYQGDGLLSGHFVATLDFKIWAKETLAICCYFTLAEAQRKIQLTVYCNRCKGLYTMKESGIDFACCPVKTLYEIDIISVEGKSIIFQHCEIVKQVTK